LRPVVKYSITLFVFLLVGYTQVFAIFYRPLALPSFISKVKHVSQLAVPSSKSFDLDEVYLEEEEREEEDRFTSKKFSGESLYLPLSNSLLIKGIDQSASKRAMLDRHINGYSYYKASYLALGVFRL
jgi:hypothetical protein